MRARHFLGLFLTAAVLFILVAPQPVRQRALSTFNPRDPTNYDRLCMAYSGTLVTYGQGTGVVVASGVHTEIGRISAMLAHVETLTTPLLDSVRKVWTGIRLASHPAREELTLLFTTRMV